MTRRTVVVDLQHSIHARRQLANRPVKALPDQRADPALQRDERPGPQALAMFEIRLSPPAHKTQQATTLIMGGHYAASIGIGLPVAQEILPTLGREVGAPHLCQAERRRSVFFAKGGNH